MIITEDLYDTDYVERFTEGFDALRAAIEAVQPRGHGAPLRHRRPSTMREVARIYATARAAMIFWGMGISQHVHGTDNARCLIALALDHRAGRPARCRACTRCAARTTCRAPRTPG